MKNSKKKGAKKYPQNVVREDDHLSGNNRNNVYEPSDSEDEYSQHEKMLLEKVRSSSSQGKSKKKVAVMDLPLHDDEDDDDNMEDDSDENDDDDANMDSDIEGKEDDFHLPDQRAWGKTRKNYYNTDYVDQDYGGFDGDDAETAELEEQEALAIQKRLAAELDDNDFTLDVFTMSKENDQVVDKPTEEVIKTDLSQLSSRQKLALLQKEAPELVGIISEFRDLMEELKNTLQPAMSLVQGKKIASPQLIQYIRTKYHLVNNYAMNIGFYLLLRARRLAVSAHPVVKRLLQYRQLLQQLDPLEELVSHQLQELLTAFRDGTLSTLQENGVDTKKKNKNVQLLSLAKAAEVLESDNSDDSDSEIKALPKSKLHSKAVKSKVDTKAKDEMEMPWQNSLNDSETGDAPWMASDNDGDSLEDPEDLGDSQIDEDGESKRAITWQMAKNKGLTPHRKKEQRNPRVKHRSKFRKAKIRRKGQVREPRTEVQRYGGEFSGIKKSVTKSIKIK